MFCSLQHPIRSAATLAVLGLVALGISPAALASYSGGPDRADIASLEADRATRTVGGSYSGGPDRSDAASLAADRTSSTGSYSVGPDRSHVPRTAYELDPAIRTAIAARAIEASVAPPVAKLDPAIRTAIAARAIEAPVTPPVAKPVAEPILASDDGFAWGAAALGLGFGVVGMSLVFGCVTLVRHDGRLRSA
jgi:hypothetical protein